MVNQNKFSLTKNFIRKYKKKTPPFGYNGLGEIVYMRTYSRKKEDGTKEQWWETVKRVVEGTYNLQKEWIEHWGLGWNPWKGQKSAQEMYDKIFNMKFLPPGRGLWAMGTDIIDKKRLIIALNNCAFVSTETIKDDPAKPFAFIMDVSMLGVGCGFDTRGAGTIVIQGPDESRETETYTIPDTREGWVESVSLLLESYFRGSHPIEFNYDEVRPEGVPIKTFGGISSGPGPLRDLHNNIRNVLDNKIGEPLADTTIVDIANMIGVCVVSGGVRRTALLALGDHESDEYLDLKDYELNPDRVSYGWSSNNSILGKLGMDYGPIAERIRNNGEPGIVWMDNIHAYSRMNGVVDDKDIRAKGVNPCAEQPLDSYEVCNLVETFPARHDSLEEYMRTLKYAYLYAKTVSLGNTHWPETNRVLLRNRRIGCSISGVAQFLAKHDIHTLREWLLEGYNYIQDLDKEYSDWMAVPRSIKTTTVKPSGTVSLLAGSTPGVHYPISRYYIRRVRLNKNNFMVKVLEKANYSIEPAVDAPESTVVVSVPIDVGEGVRSLEEVSMWEQLNLTAFIQEHWSDNAVSSTISFNPETEGKDIERALDMFQYRLKDVSFLPNIKGGAYKQMPYEAIDEQTYKSELAKLSTIDYTILTEEEAEDGIGEKYCDGDSCQLT